MPSEQEQDQLHLVINVTNRFREMGDLAMWTVYEHPRDYPEDYVARCFRVRGGPNATEHTLVNKSLHQLRIVMLAAGLVCLTRSDDDEAQIVETWF